MDTSTGNINNNFFDGVYREVWKQLIPPGLSAAETDFIIEVGGLTNSSHVLDLMCGYGRHALELARRSVHVTAIDSSESYISEIEEQAKAQALPVRSMAGDISTIPFDGQFDMAICMGNSFAFFDRKDALNILGKTADVLKPGGVFLINSWMIAEIALKHYREKDWINMPDYKYLIENEFHFDPARIESVHTVIAATGTAEIINGIDYIFTLGELSEMFRETGFKLSALYSTPRKRKFQFGDTRVYIVAEKRS